MCRIPPHDPVNPRRIVSPRRGSVAPPPRHLPVKARYPETKRLRQVNGVGAVTALTFVLTLEDPSRCHNNRVVGAFLGICPKRNQSGKSEPEMRISKAGDPELRRLLVQSAQYILGPFGTDCDLRRFGVAMAMRGNKAAKRRALVAVARKLAVLLHRLWLSSQDYEPLRHAKAVTRGRSHNANERTRLIDGLRLVASANANQTSTAQSG